MSEYNGETKKKIISGSIENKQENIKTSWSFSGATGHTRGMPPQRNTKISTQMKISTASCWHNRMKQKQ